MTLTKDIIKHHVVNLCDELNIPLPSKPQTVGRLGELLYYKKMRDEQKQFKALCLLPKYSSHDFLVDDKKIEVKASLKGHRGRYTFIFTKNIGKFDTLVCILIEADRTPLFVEIPREKLEGMTALAGKRDYFNKYLRG